MKVEILTDHLNLLNNISLLITFSHNVDSKYKWFVKISTFIAALYFYKVVITTCTIRKELVCSKSINMAKILSTDLVLFYYLIAIKDSQMVKSELELVLPFV